MKLLKRSLGIFLALLLMASVPVAAFAEEYDIANGSIGIYAEEDGQYVWQGDAEEGVKDAAPVITGSSDDAYIHIYSNGNNVNVTLNNVEANYIDIYAEGDTTVTVQGTNNFDVWCDWYDGSITIEGDGTLNIVDDAFSGLELYNANVTIDGATVNSTAALCGIYMYNSSLTVESGAVTGTATGAIPDYEDMLYVGTYDEDESEEAEASEGFQTAGIYVGEDSSLTVNGGTVTGVSEVDFPDHINAGIAFEEGSTLTLGEGMQVLNADGEDITEAAVADPMSLNEIAQTTIQEIPQAAPQAAAIPVIASTVMQKIVSEIKDADGNPVEGSVNVTFFGDNTFRVIIRTANDVTTLTGRFEVKDGELVFTLKNGTEIKLNADSVLVITLPNGGTVEVKLEKEVIDILLASF